MQWFEDVMVKQTSAALEESNGKKTCAGEMLQYLGLWLLMATCSLAYRPCPYNGVVQRYNPLSALY